MFFRTVISRIARLFYMGGGGEPPRSAEPTTFRTRVRFLLSKRLQIADPRYDFELDGRPVTLLSYEKSGLIKDSDWLVLLADGFATEEDARAFGSRAIDAFMVAAVRQRTGVDAGHNKPTTRVPEEVVSKLREQGFVVRDDVHGVDAYLERADIVVPSLVVRATTYLDAPGFVADVDTCFRAMPAGGHRHADHITLLNASFASEDALSATVLAISAVEMLAGEEKWSDEQHKLLHKLEEAAREMGGFDDAARNEVADAIARGHKLSIRQGIFRLLDRLGLRDLRKEWDRLYSDRSKLFHGSTKRSAKSELELAVRAQTLCGRIILTALAQEVPHATTDLNEHFPADPTVRHSRVSFRPQPDGTVAITLDDLADAFGGEVQAEPSNKIP